MSVIETPLPSDWQGNQAGLQRRRRWYLKRQAVMPRLTDDERRLRNLARWVVAGEVKRGVRPPASSLTCEDCGAAALEYHHHNGYEPRHKSDVIPLCNPCHQRRDIVWRCVLVRVGRKPRPTRPRPVLEGLVIHS